METKSWTTMSRKMLQALGNFPLCSASIAVQPFVFPNLEAFNPNCWAEWKYWENAPLQVILGSILHRTISKSRKVSSIPAVSRAPGTCVQTWAVCAGDVGSCGTWAGSQGEVQCDEEMEGVDTGWGGSCCSVPQHPHFQLSQDTVLPFCACTAPAAAEAWMGWVFSACKKRQRLTLGRRIIGGEGRWGWIQGCLRRCEAGWRQGTCALGKWHPLQVICNATEGMCCVLSKGSSALLCSCLLLMSFQHSLPCLQHLSLCPVPCWAVIFHPWLCGVTSISPSRALCPFIWTQIGLKPYYFCTLCLPGDLVWNPWHENWTPFKESVCGNQIIVEKSVFMLDLSSTGL